MSSRRKRTKTPCVKFPRRRWVEGQKPRTEKPKKGKGSYSRRQAKRIEPEG